MSATAASSLAFSISPTKKLTKSNQDEDDEIYVLTLAPFTRPPKINFGQVKLNSSVERNLLIINPQQFSVELNINSNELNINNIRLTLEKEAKANLKIKWQPDRADYYKYSIFLEVCNTARLKFVVHAYGVCVKPDPKKSANIRRPFAMLQPLKKEKSTEFINKTATTNPPMPVKIIELQAVCIDKENKAKPIARESWKTVTVTKSSAFIKKAATDKRFMDFYRNELNRNTDEEDEIEEVYDRRKTCVIRSPKFCKSTVCVCPGQWLRP